MPRIPKYRVRPDRGTAYVEIRGERIPLSGKAHSQESLAAYYAILSRENAGALPSPTAQVPPSHPVTVNGIAVMYLRHLEQRWVSGTLTKGEVGHTKAACRPLTRMYGDTLASDFGPVALQAVREAMLSGSWVRPGEGYAGWSRKYTNHQVGRLRALWKWAVSCELVPAVALTALQALPALRATTEDDEEEDVQPVDEAHVRAVLPYVTSVVRALIEVLWLTGMRPTNACEMRPCEIDMTVDPWLYTPRRHKGTWRGKKKALVVPLGPQVQAILRPFIEGRPADAYLFSPKESERLRCAQRRQLRTTPVQPSQVARRPKNPHSGRNAKYDKYGLRRAILYGIRAANKAREIKAEKEGRKPELIPHWHPYQLRHARATLLNAAYGIEAAQVTLGHSHAAVTQIYAARNLELAKRIAKERG